MKTETIRKQILSVLMIAALLIVMLAAATLKPQASSTSTVTTPGNLRWEGTVLRWYAYDSTLIGYGERSFTVAMTVTRSNGYSLTMNLPKTKDPYFDLGALGWEPITRVWPELKSIEDLNRNGTVVDFCVKESIEVDKSKYPGVTINDSKWSSNAPRPYFHKVRLNTGAGATATFVYTARGQKIPRAKVEETAEVPEGMYIVGWYSDAGLAEDTHWVFEKDTLPAEPQTDMEEFNLYAKTVSSESHVHDNAVFKPWDRTDILPDKAGSYYLVRDIALSSTWNVPGDVDLCMNGHKVSTADGKNFDTLIKVEEGNALRLYANGEENEIITGVKKYNDGGFVTYYAHGAVYVNGGTFIMRGGKISGNEANYGAGVYGDNGAMIEIRGGSITGNSARKQGGGVYLNNATVTMYNGSIDNNYADSYGGGVSMSNGRFEMLDGSISDNKTSRRNMPAGGGVYMQGGSGKFSMKGGTISGNESQKGGGICVPVGTLELYAGTITKNNVSGYDDSYDVWGNAGYGGGVYVDTYGGAKVEIPKGAGKIVISGNVKDSSQSDLYLWGGGLKVTGSPAGDSRIGILTRLTPETGSPYVFATGAGINSRFKDIFSSNNKNYGVEVNDKGEGELRCLWNVEYSAGDHGSGSMAGKTAADGESIDLPDCGYTPQEHYVFAGWKIGSKTYDAGESVKVTSDITVTATWKIKEYSISYDLGGGSIPEGETNPVSYSGLYGDITLANPARRGYEFLGWTGTDLSEVTKNVTIPDGSSGDRSYTANWKIIRYNITYSLNGGSEMPEGTPTSYTVEDKVKIPAPVSEGEPFTGWMGTDLEDPTENVVIEKGSIGGRSYYATWRDHKWDEGTVTAAPDCEHDGTYTYKCTTCSAVRTKSIEKLGHNYSGRRYVWSDDNRQVTGIVYCTRNAAHEPKDRQKTVASHIIENESQAATCTEKGRTAYAAEFHTSDFIAVKRTVTVPALGHDWSEWETKTQPTETANGVAERHCKRDGCGAVETKEIPAIVHEHDYKFVDKVDAGCETAGTKEHFECTKCGDWFEANPKGKELSAFDSDPENISEEVPGEEKDRSYFIIQPVNHSEGEPQHENVKEATCTEEGSYDENVYCTICDQLLRSTPVTVPVKDHNFDEGTVIEEPTYTKEGKIRYTCKDCGYQKEETLPVLRKEVEDLWFMEPEVYMGVGDSYSLWYIVMPDDAYTGDIVWSSDDSSIAEVSEGVVQGKAPGATTISVSAADGKFTDYCTVFVYGTDAEKEARQLILDEHNAGGEGSFLLGRLWTGIEGVIDAADSGSTDVSLTEGFDELFQSVEGVLGDALNKADIAEKAAKGTGNFDLIGDAQREKETIQYNIGRISEVRTEFNKAAEKLAENKEAADKDAARKAEEEAAAKKAAAEAAVKEAERQGIRSSSVPKVTMSAPKAGKKAITAKWKKLSKQKRKKAGSIEIWVCPDKKFRAENTKIVTAGKGKASKKIKGLKAKTRYYVKVRAVKKSGGVKHVGKWSKTKSIRTK